MRRFLGLAVGLVLVAGAWAVADDTAKAPGDELKQLQKSVTDAQRKASDLHRRLLGVEDADVMQRLSEQLRLANIASRKTLEESHAKAIEIAKANAKEEVGLDATLWVLPAMRAKPDQAGELLELVIQHHAANKKISSAVAMLTMMATSDPKAIDMLDLIAEKNPTKSVRAAALFAVADFYKNKSEPRRGSPPADAEELAQRAEARFERILKEFADEIQVGQRKFGPMAKAALFELRNLRIGKTVPEIEGEDTEGVVFRLSDYRGKVVMLDFWGHW
jgi:hypothetical protein